MRHPLLTSLLVLSIVSTQHVKFVRAQVIETEIGKVEFIGLKSWSPHGLVDTLEAISPDMPLYACAATLRSQLGFPDASVMNFANGDDEIDWVITVVEPADADRVQYRQIPVDTVGTVEEWRSAAAELAKAPVLFATLRSYGYVLKEEADSAGAIVSKFGLEVEEIEPLWTFLQEHDRSADRDLALWTLTNGSDYGSRTVAAAVLANFPDSDLVMWRLVDSFRDPAAPVSSASMEAALSLAKHTERNVNWKPATTSLRNILSGTNLFAYLPTLELLQLTGRAGLDAGDLLRDTTHPLLLATVQAQHDSVRGKAQDFLVFMNGEDLETPDAWENWLVSLTANKQ